MLRLEVSAAVRHIYMSLGFKRLSGAAFASTGATLCCRHFVDRGDVN